MIPALLVLAFLAVAFVGAYRAISSVPPVPEMVDRALDSGEALDLARAVGVVAGPDLEWQLDLARIYRDYDAYRFGCRLPGEGR